MKKQFTSSQETKRDNNMDNIKINEEYLLKGTGGAGFKDKKARVYALNGSSFGFYQSYMANEKLFRIVPSGSEIRSCWQTVLLFTYYNNTFLNYIK